MSHPTPESHLPKKFRQRATNLSHSLNQEPSISHPLIHPEKVTFKKKNIFDAITTIQIKKPLLHTYSTPIKQDHSFQQQSQSDKSQQIYLS